MKKIKIFGISCLTAMILAACSTSETPPETTATVPVTTQSESESAPETTVETVEETQIADHEIKTKVRIAALKGPTAMGMVKMMSDDSQTEDPVYDFQVITAIDEITASIIKGDLDLAAVPANLASVLYQNSNGQIKVLAVNTLGVLNIVENQETIQTIADLKGKTIYATGKGATPELALTYILNANGLTIGEDVMVEFKSEPAECVAILAQQDHAVAMLPQPFVTTAMMKNDTIRIALDLTKEWEKVNSESALLTGVVVVRADFIEKSPVLLDQFLDQYKASVDYVNENPTEAAALIEAYDIVPATVAEQAIPNCNIVMIEGTEMKDKLSGYLAVLLEQKPESVGGKLPDEEFYYIR